MLQGLLTLPVLVPVLFWSAYHYHKDRHLPEPALNLLACFVLGIGSSLAAKQMYAALTPFGLRYDALALADANPLGLLAYCLLAIGPIEELAKLLPFVVVVLRFKAFDEPLDGIIYASFIALGYAAAENVYYLQYLSPIEAAARGFASPVVHIVFASIWGHWIGSARLRGRSVALHGLAGFALAATAHGIYDFIVLLRAENALLAAAGMIVIIWLWRLRLMNSLHREAVAATPRDNEDAG